MSLNVSHHWSRPIAFIYTNFCNSTNVKMMENKIIHENDHLSLVHDLLKTSCEMCIVFLIIIPLCSNPTTVGKQQQNEGCVAYNLHSFNLWCWQCSRKAVALLLTRRGSKQPHQLGLRVGIHSSFFTDTTLWPSTWMQSVNNGWMSKNWWRHRIWR